MDWTGGLTFFALKTRNTHAHLCLTPVRRLCTRVIYAGAGEVRMAHVSEVGSKVNSTSVGQASVYIGQHEA